MPPTVREKADRPLWKQVEAKLLEEIRHGRFRGLARLPAEHDLAELFGVNRHTARQALAELVQRGIVFKRKGGGSYLVPTMLDYEIGSRTRFSANIALQGREPSRHLLDIGQIAADAAVAEALALRADAPVIAIKAVGQADDVPISLSRTWLPAERFPGFEALYRTSMSITEALSHFGVDDYTRDVTRITARNPSEEDRHYLKQPATIPILAVESIDIDAGGRPIVFHETRFAGERVQFVVR
jgi:GntR family phosphonate transport system transcriptional regulator